MNKINFNAPNIEHFPTIEEINKPYELHDLIGTMWLQDNHMYIFAQVDFNTFAMISVTEGNRYDAPFQFDNIPSSMSDFTRYYGLITLTAEPDEEDEEIETPW